MRVIIAGSRHITDAMTISNAIISSGFDITEVVSGGACGVDSLGELWAKSRKIPIKQFIPRWDLYGLAAGPRRNAQMARYADALIAIYDGKSKGTSNMIAEAKKRRLYVHIIIV
ncbi:MAG: SLOG family protein [Methanogenium sp.]|jgi:hypothetical protein